MNPELSLVFSLTQRNILARYKGSALGLFWSLLTPLFLLLVYTFVFGSIFKSRWPAAEDGTSQGEFAIILFSGLILFQLFAEVINGAPGIVLAHSNYVKKVVFPLQILVPVALLTSLFHMGVSFIILFLAMILFQGGIPSTALLFPIVLLPFCLLVLGLGWILASLGTYIRDIGQAIGTIVTALLFTAPIFFPYSALPTWIQPFVIFNPLTIPVELSRELVVFGNIPNFSPLISYTIIATVIAALGYFWFQSTRKGFADVL